MTQDTISMNNFQKLIFGSQNSKPRRDPTVTYYMGRESIDYNLLQPANSGAPYDNYYKMDQEDNQDPFELFLGLADPDRTVSSINVLIENTQGIITPWVNVPFTRLNQPEQNGTTIRLTTNELNGFYDTYNDPQPEIGVTIEIILKNNKTITLDQKLFMRYRLSGPGTNVQRYVEGAYNVFEIPVYIDGAMSYEPHDPNGCMAGWTVSKTQSNVPQGYYNVIVKSVYRGREWSYPVDITTPQKINFRPDIPDNLPKEQITPMLFKVYIYRYGVAANAEVEFHAIRNNVTLRTFKVNKTLYPI